MPGIISIGFPFLLIIHEAIERLLLLLNSLYSVPLDEYLLKSTSSIPDFKTRELSLISRALLTGTATWFGDTVVPSKG